MAGTRSPVSLPASLPASMMQPSCWAAGTQADPGSVAAAFVDDWLVCIARRWQTTESTTAAWLLAEGAGYLYALEDKGHTDWRTGPNRWVIPEGPAGPPRLIEMPGESLQTTVGWLASRRGDDQTGIVTLAVAVGARMWLDDHGCACGPHHTPGAGS